VCNTGRYDRGFRAKEEPFYNHRDRRYSFRALKREINEHERFFKIRKLTDRLIERRARNLGRLEWERREALKCSNERNENDMVNKKGYMVTGIDLPETHPSNSKNGKQGTECNESNDDNTYYSSTISYSSETVGEDKGKGNGVAAYEAILEEHRKNQIGNKFENVPIPIALKAEFEKDSMYKNMEQIRKLAGFKPGLKRISNVSIIDPKISYEYYKDTSREEAQKSFREMFGIQDSNYTLEGRSKGSDCTLNNGNSFAPAQPSIDDDDDNDDLSSKSMMEEKVPADNFATTYLDVNNKASEKHQTFAEPLRI